MSVIVMCIHFDGIVKNAIRTLILIIAIIIANCKVYFFNEESVWMLEINIYIFQKVLLNYKSSFQSSNIEIFSPSQGSVSSVSIKDKNLFDFGMTLYLDQKRISENKFIQTFFYYM